MKTDFITYVIIFFCASCFGTFVTTKCNDKKETTIEIIDNSKVIDSLNNEIEMTIADYETIISGLHKIIDSLISTNDETRNRYEDIIESYKHVDVISNDSIMSYVRYKLNK